MVNFASAFLQVTITIITGFSFRYFSLVNVPHLNLTQNLSSLETELLIQPGETGTSQHILVVIHAMIHIYFLWDCWDVLYHCVFDLEVWNYDLTEQLKIILKWFCIAFRAFVFLISRFQDKISLVAQIEKNRERPFGCTVHRPDNQWYWKAFPVSFSSSTSWSPGFIQCSPEHWQVPNMFKENSWFFLNLFLIFFLVNVDYKNSAILNTFLQRRL